MKKMIALLPELDANALCRAWPEDFRGFDLVGGRFRAGEDLH